MRAFSLEFLKPFPFFIEGFSVCLVEESNVIPKFNQLPGGKYLQRNTLDKAFQVLNELTLDLRSQDFAFSFKESKKSLNQMAPLETPLILMASHFFKNDEIYVLGFSKGYPPNCSY